jgi:hypothetical protein
MWLRSHPAERTVLLALSALAALVMVSALVGHMLPAGSSTSGGSAGQTAGVGVDGTGQIAGPSPAATPPPAIPAASFPATGSLTQEGTLPDQASLAQARSVAGGFLAAYGSYAYNDPPGALRARVRPFDTDRLDQELGQSSGASELRQQQAARHETATATVDSLDPEGYAYNGELGFVAAVRQDVRSDQGTSSQKRYYELLMTQTRSGWRVEEVTE